jgi:hypothetical protein
MKFLISKWLRFCMLIVGFAYLTGCAVQKYSYDQEDAGTVFLSQTTNLAMSPHATAWSITFVPLDEKTRKELPIFELPISTRIYGFAGKPEEQFQILSQDKFGNAKQTTKLPPGRYKIDAINRQEKLIQNNAPAGFLQHMYNEKNKEPPAILKNLIRSHDAKSFPSIEFEVLPGKAIYLGSFNAGMYDCTKVLLLHSCAKFQVNVTDEFERDKNHLKNYLSKRPNEPMLEFVNQTLKIDKVKSPYLFSEQ